MDILITVLLVLIILAIIGVIAYMAYDYSEYKKATDANLARANTDIQAEGAARVSNVRYVVDQVNKVNTDIYRTMTSNVTRLDARADGLKTINDQQQAMLLSQQSGLSNLSLTSGQVVGGLNSLISIQSNVGMSASAPGGLSLLNLPGMVNPDVRLMQHVTAVSGMKVTNLDASGAGVANFQICARPDASNNVRCVRFPNASGDTYLTGLTPSASVIVDAPSTVTGAMSFGTADKVTTYGQISGAAANGGTLSLSANSLSLASPATATTATPFKVSVASTDRMVLDAQGNVTFTTPKLSLKNNSQTADITFDGTSGKMVLTPASGSKTGTLRVQGNIEATGTITPSAA